MTRHDARGIITTYSYDALNRVTSKTYNDNGVTPPANFYYDESAVSLGSCSNSAVSNPIGRLTHTTTGSPGAYLTATVQDYDPMGRVSGYWQATPSYCGTSMWATYYNYDVAGDVTSWVHPAGFTITNTLSAARRITQITSSWNDATHPGTLAQNILYNAAGGPTGLQNGCVGSGCTPLQETYAYNNRLQPVMIELGTSGNPTADSCRVYNFYGGTSNPTSCAMPLQGSNNNGNVAGYYYHDNVNTGLSHSAAYTYDPVNRLASAVATGNVAYSQSFSYDAFGNLSCAQAGPGCVALSFNTATNRITSSGYTYDAAGNLTGDGTYTYQWDAEAHLIAVLDGQERTVSANTYNALGQRVRDVTLTSTTEEAYGAGGELLWRFTGDSNDRKFVPFEGGILAEYWSGGTLFDHPDELGSITAASDQTGNNFQERLFYPFGERWTGVDLNNFGVHQTFSKLPDYDAETDQYNTLNRHYSPSGRWLSPDPGGVKVVRLDDPQTWNMYAYVRNNPTTLEDPSGLAPTDPDTLDSDERKVWFDIAKNMRSFEESQCVGCIDPDIIFRKGNGEYLAANPAQVIKDEVEDVANEVVDKVVKRLVDSAKGVLAGASEGIVGLADVPGALLMIVLAAGDLNPVDDVALINAENTKGKRRSTKQDHELGLARKQRDRGGEKGDKRPPRKRPKPQGGRQWKGPWPPKDGQPWW